MIQKLKKLKCGKIYEDVDLSKYTSYKLQGKAKVLVVPESLKDFEKLMHFIKENKYQYKIIGGGSNLIFKGDYEGILIKLGFADQLKIEDNKIIVGANYPTMKLALKVSRMGYTGLEFATGIPGTIGGAVFNNAGAYGSDMGYVVESILVLTPELTYKRLYNRELDFHYRASFLKNNPEYICLEATIIVGKGNENEIMEIIEDRKRRRLMGQPLDFPSAGSVFRNPPDNYAGKLIEDLGYKGKRVGDAEVSSKHANFIINTGKATGEDIVTLINQIKKDVKEKYKIDLILEQEIVE